MTARATRAAGRRRGPRRVRDGGGARLLGGRREVGAQPAHRAPDVVAHLRGPLADRLGDALLEVAQVAPAGLELGVTRPR